MRARRFCLAHSCILRRVHKRRLINASGMNNHHCFWNILLCSLFQSGEMSQEVLPPAHSSLPALPERLGLRVMSTCSLSHKQIMSWSGFWQYSVSSLDFLLQSGCGSGCGRAEYQVPVMYKNTSPRAFLQGSQGHSLFCRQEAEA